MTTNFYFGLADDDALDVVIWTVAPATPPGKNETLLQLATIHIHFSCARGVGGGVGTRKVTSLQHDLNAMPTYLPLHK